MSKNITKTETNQQYSNQYGFMSTPITPQMQSVLTAAEKPVGIDPSIQHRFASMEEDVRRSYADPFGAGTSADVRAKAQRSQILTVQRERDKAMREGYQQADQIGFGRKLTAAGLTMPQLVQTGGTSSGNQNTSQGKNAFGNFMDVAGMALGAAGAF